MPHLPSLSPHPVHHRHQLLRRSNLIVLTFHLAESAVFGDAFQQLAEVAVLGAEAGDGGAVDFGVGFGGNFPTLINLSQSINLIEAISKFVYSAHRRMSDIFYVGIIIL